MELWSTPPSNYKEVTKKEFILFIKTYKNSLVLDWCGIGDVPFISYNDFSRETGKEIIAYCLDYKNEEYYHFQPTKYYTLK